MKMNEKHKALAELMGTPTDTRTQAQKAAAIGFSEPHACNLKKVPEFMVLVNAALERNKPELLALADLTVSRQLHAGNPDPRWADLAYKRCGAIQTGGNQVVRVEQNNAGRCEETLEEAMQRVTRERVVSADEG